MHLIGIAVIICIGYFLVTGATFLIFPAMISKYDLAPTSPAGNTEVRCYYGALALGLGAFVAWLASNGLGRQAITGVLFIATAILLVRVVGTALDNGWSSSYTKLAIPVETGFVLALSLVLIFG